jgi:hypothetical protein
MAMSNNQMVYVCMHISYKSPDTFGVSGRNLRQVQFGRPDDFTTGAAKIQVPRCKGGWKIPDK